LEVEGMSGGLRRETGVLGLRVESSFVASGHFR
jgi:hypothetical protein